MSKRVNRPEIVLLTYLLIYLLITKENRICQCLVNNSALLPNVPVSQDMVFPCIRMFRSLYKEVSFTIILITLVLHC